MYSENNIPSVAVFIASQHAVFSQNLYSHLSQQKDFNVIGAMHPVKVSQHFHQTGRPAAGQDLVLVLDISSPLPEAGQLLADWHAQQPDSKTLIVSDTLTEGFMLEALRYGARGFLLKTCPLEMYAKAIRVIHAGDFWVGRKMLVHLIQNFCQTDTLPLQEKPPNQDKNWAKTDKGWDGVAQLGPNGDIQQVNGPASSFIRQGQDNLTGREQEIVHYVSWGLSNKEIAKTLGVSDKTVKTHLHTIFSKLKIRRRMDLMIPPDRRYYC